MAPDRLRQIVHTFVLAVNNHTRTECDSGELLCFVSGVIYASSQSFQRQRNGNLVSHEPQYSQIPYPPQSPNAPTPFVLCDPETKISVQFYRLNAFGATESEQNVCQQGPGMRPGATRWEANLVAELQ